MNDLDETFNIEQGLMSDDLLYSIDSPLNEVANHPVNA